MFNERLLMNKKLGTIKGAVTLAASWAWGVSILVGIQIATEKGMLAFSIWATANSLALLLFGLLSLRYKGSGIVIGDVIGGNSGKAFNSLAIAIQFFSMLVNATAIKTAFTMLGLPSSLWFIVYIIILFYVFVGGFKVTVNADVYRFSFWMVALLLILTLGKSENVDISIISSSDGVSWAMWAALILLCGPLLDQQLWQRRFALKNENVKPFLYASILFAVYMLLVGSIAFFGKSENILLGIVVFLVATSTLDSSFSSVQCFGRHNKESTTTMLALSLLVIFIISFNIPLLNLWVAYGTLRIPFALVVAYKLIKWRELNVKS